MHYDEMNTDSAFGDPSGEADEVERDWIPLSTGRLQVGQLNGLLTTLPIDISFVDANDRVQYYSETPDRIFPRTPAVIGRKVTDCHPPKSVDKVVRILHAFREGSQDEATFWIELNERIVLIRYFAVRDRDGLYLGCVEVSQDVTEITKLEGERRLLDWDESA